jgi:hypothetical protein
VETEPEPAGATLAADRAPRNLAPHHDPALAAGEWVTAEPKSRGSDPQVGHYQPGFDTVRIDHLPTLEIGQIDGMSVMQQPRFDEGPQRIRTQPLIDQVVAMGTVEVQQQRGDALPGDFGDGNEQRAACHVDVLMVEREEVGQPPRNVETALGQLHRPAMRGFTFACRLILQVRMGSTVARRQEECAFVVGPEDLGGVVRQRTGVAAPGKRGEFVPTSGTAFRIQEGPFLPHHTGHAGCRRDQQGFFLGAQGNGVALRLKGQWPGQGAAQREPA